MEVEGRRNFLRSYIKGNFRRKPEIKEIKKDLNTNKQL